MAQGCVHTVHSDGRWKNKVEGEAPLPGWYDRQEIAAEAGRAHAMRRQAEHVIRNEDGTIAQRNSYRCDPASGAPQAEVENRMGLAFAMCRLVEHLLLNRDGSVDERPAHRRDAPRRHGGATALAREVHEVGDFVGSH